jgi:hypothetical protein
MSRFRIPNVFQLILLVLWIYWVFPGTPCAATSATIPTPPSPSDRHTTATPLLLFEIDEGFSTSLLTKLRNKPAEMESTLKHIEAALAELATVYPVAVLVYPTHMLRPPNAQGQPAGLDAVDPALCRLIEFFGHSPAGIKVYLELYSSGIATNQNGDLAKLPMPRLHRGNAADNGRKGLSLDLDTLAALRQRYPETLAGVRFHEVYGSDVVNQVASPRGFRLDPEVIRGTIALCRQSGMKLVWSDSNWLSKTPPNAMEPNYIYSAGQRPYMLAEPFATLQNEARHELGSNVCFNWANNNYHFAINLDLLDVKMQPSGRPVTYPLPDWFKFDSPVTHFPMKDWRDAGWGMSVQSWFWHELTYAQNGQYYMLGENNCPVEILASYCLKGLKEGARVLQFEPPWYFFNMAAHYDASYAGVYEAQPDCSARLALQRLKHVLLDPRNPANPPADLTTWFDRDQVRFIENDVIAPPRNYMQTTLALLSTTKTLEAQNRPAVFDRYSARPEWLRQDDFRFTQRVLDQPRVAIGRIELNGDGVDEFFFVQPAANGDGSQQLVCFDQNCGQLTVDTRAIVLNREHRLVALTAANVVQRVIKNADPDELLVVTCDPQGKQTVTIYQITWMADNLLGWRYTPLDPEPMKAILANMISPPPGLEAQMVGLYGLRTEAVLHKNLTRALDRVVTRYRTAHGPIDLLLLQLAAKQSSVEVGRGELLCAADLDLDRRDELVGLRPEAVGNLAFFAIAAQDAGLSSVALPLPNPGKIDVKHSLLTLSLRKMMLLNAK